MMSLHIDLSNYCGRMEQRGQEWNKEEWNKGGVLVYDIYQNTPFVSQASTCPTARRHFGWETRTRLRRDHAVFLRRR